MKTCDAYRLMHEGAIALSLVESAGMRVDVGRLQGAIKDVHGRVESLVKEQLASDLWKVWKRKFGDKASLGSRDQLGVVLFGEGGAGYDPPELTKNSQKYKMDEDVLARIEDPFVDRFLLVEKLKKLETTYLVGLLRECVDGFVHPKFDLHLVSTYRSSSSSPNFQNIPIRHPEFGRIIRECFVPRPGRVLVEVDYSALEFRVAACFWKDPEMVSYASDSSKDIHWEMAMRMFRVKDDSGIDKVEKKVLRFHGKNGFVFPELYGSLYQNICSNVWDTIETKRVTVFGVPAFDWLEEHGVYSRGACELKQPPEKGTFEHHLMLCDRKFNETFPVWSTGKERWMRDYRRKGWFRTMTGFVCSGSYTRNQLYNYPVQGPAFHCLLWTLVRVVRELRKRKMESLVVGQIHDSIVADVPEEELSDFIGLVRRIATKDIRDEWDWLIVPLDVEVEVGRENWYKKERWDEGLGK